MWLTPNFTQYNKGYAYVHVALAGLKIRIPPIQIWWIQLLPPPPPRILQLQFHEVWSFQLVGPMNFTWSHALAFNLTRARLTWVYNTPPSPGSPVDLISSKFVQVRMTALNLDLQAPHCKEGGGGGDGGWKESIDQLKKHWSADCNWFTHINLW